MLCGVADVGPPTERAARQLRKVEEHDEFLAIYEGFPGLLYWPCHQHDHDCVGQGRRYCQMPQSPGLSSLVKSRFDHDLPAILFAPQQPLEIS